MPQDGVLTTIDVEVEHQRAAKKAFAEPGLRTTRTRPIRARAKDVSPGLAAGASAMLFVDADKESSPVSFAPARRSLRPGGVLAVENALGHSRVAAAAR